METSAVGSQNNYYTVITQFELHVLVAKTTGDRHAMS